MAKIFINFSVVLILIVFSLRQCQPILSEDMYSSKALNESNYLNLLSKVIANQMSTKRPDIETNSLIGSVNQMRSLVSTEEIPTQRCQYVISFFGLIVSQFIECLLINQIPFNICLNCSQQFSDLLSAYKDLTNASVSNCSQSFINGDKISVIQSLYDNTITQWTDGNCDNCFSGNDENQNLVVNNDTKYFFRLTSDYINCTDVRPKLNSVNNSCVECKQTFDSINDFYDSIESNYSTHVCNDIINSMKDIRKHWSETLDCPIDSKSSYQFMALVIAVTILPFVLYLTGRLFCADKYKTLMKQKRLSTYHLESNENQPFLQ